MSLSSRVSPHLEATELPRNPVGSLEGQCSPAKRRMPLMRVPGARVAMLTVCDTNCHALHTVLEDDLTTVIHYRSTADLTMAERPDVLVMDRVMIHDSGLELRRIRQHWPTCMLIVTGAADEHDAAQLMNLGADDALLTGHQLVGPRLRAATRRARAINAGTRIAIGDIIFDRESSRVWCAGQEVRMTRTEKALLDCLFWYAPRTATIAALTSFAWAQEGLRERPNLVQVYIGYLRKKLRGSRHVVIRTVRGEGYEFAERSEHAAD